MKPSIEKEPSINSAVNFENILKLAPAFTAVILIISITYDSAYLWALSLSLGDLPSSISEHIRSAILWAPIVFMYTVIIGSIFLLEDTNSINKKVKTSSEIQEALIGKREIIINILVLLTLGYVIYETKNHMYVFILFAAIWMQILIKFASLRAKRNLTISVQLRYFLILPVLLSAVGFNGYFLGNRLLNSNKPQWEYSIKKEDKEVILNVFGQRRFTEFTIAIINDKKILIISNENITSIKSL